MRAAQRHRRHPAGAPGAIRPAYEQHGVEDYYRQFGATYRNPHERAVRAAIHQALARWPLDCASVLDLACGSGEVTLALREAGCEAVGGVDPFTGEAYRERTGATAEPYTFAEIAAGALEGRRYSLIICSFALHLVESSRLPLLAYQLSRIAPALLILSPHKRPALRSAWGWALQDELSVERVHARLYKRR